MKIAVIAVLLAGTAAAQVTGWKREPVGYTGFTADFPTGPGVDELRGKHKSGERFHFIHIANKGEKPNEEDLIHECYTKNSLIAVESGALGEPELMPLKTFKRWGFTVTEAAWRYKWNGRMKRQYAYEVEVVPGRYVDLSLNCFEPACTKYIPIYMRMRDSMQPPLPPPPKKKA